MYALILVLFFIGQGEPQIVVKSIPSLEECRKVLSTAPGIIANYNAVSEENKKVVTYAAACAPVIKAPIKNTDM